MANILYLENYRSFKIWCKILEIEFNILNLLLSSKIGRNILKMIKILFLIDYKKILGGNFLSSSISSEGLKNFTDQSLCNRYLGIELDCSSIRLIAHLNQIFVGLKI